MMLAIIEDMFIIHKPYMTALIPCLTHGDAFRLNPGYN